MIEKIPDFSATSGEKPIPQDMNAFAEGLLRYTAERSLFEAKAAHAAEVRKRALGNRAQRRAMRKGKK